MLRPQITTNGYESQFFINKWLDRTSPSIEMYRNNPLVFYKVR